LIRIASAIPRSNMNDSELPIQSQTIPEHLRTLWIYYRTGFHWACPLAHKSLPHVSEITLTNGSQSPESINRLHDFARCSVRGNPDESTAYGLTTEMLIEHWEILDVGPSSTSFAVEPEKVKRPTK